MITPELHQKLVKEFRQIARDTAIRCGVTDEDAIKRLEDGVEETANKFAPTTNDNTTED